ncbi:MAG: hypothetical protein ACRDPX_05430 [Gaiellaceae bacterium]
MSKKVLLALAVCTAVAGLSAGPALAGEVTGNDKDTQGPANANSICVFSGQNDDPQGLDPANGPPGRTQSYGQDVKSGALDPSSLNPGKVEGPIPHPGFACNGNHGFFAEG